MFLITKHMLLRSVTRNFSSALGHPGIYSQKVLHSGSEAESETLTNVFNWFVFSLCVEMVIVLISPRLESDSFPKCSFQRLPVFRRGVCAYSPQSVGLSRFQFLSLDTLVFILNTINISHSNSPLLTSFDLWIPTPLNVTYKLAQPLPRGGELRAGFHGLWALSVSPASCFSIAMEMQFCGWSTASPEKGKVPAR